MKVLDAASKGWKRGPGAFIVDDERSMWIASAEFIWGDDEKLVTDTQAANLAIIVHAREMLELLWELYGKGEEIDDVRYERIVDMVHMVEGTYKELTGE